MRTLVWYRGKELRVHDHAPLADGIAKGEVICAFVLDPYFFAKARARELPHRMQFLLESIAELGSILEAMGGTLVLVEGKSVDVIPKFAREWNVDRVVAQRWTEPFGRTRDERIARALHVPFELFDGETLAPPGDVVKSDGTSYGVFTPFARAFRNTIRVDAPKNAPRKINALPSDVRVKTSSLPTLLDLGIERNDRILVGGESQARTRLRTFVTKNAARYPDERNRTDLDSTSKLAADLKFGTLSARTVWTAVHDALGDTEAWQVFSNELLWREFTHSVLWHDPKLLLHPRRAEFERIAWTKDTALWKAWAEGTTGFPIIDAAARQLLTEGFVHNRARMITASFLVKDLLVDYRQGEAHYMKYLTDGDWAQNNFNWQWTAGCGFDAQPFFRVFNPMDQGARFDPTGAYVRKWIPELAKVSDADLHAPWEATDIELRAAGVTLGKTYPRPIVNHAEARLRFLAAAKRAFGNERALT